jgi:hypothetical protein
MLRPWVYSIGTLIGGLFFYWLRSNHKAVYGLCEIVISFVIIYIAYFPHGGGTLLAGDDYVPPPLGSLIASSVVAFFGSVYVFVRGCDNFVTGIRNPHDS